jgi:hypothetical protein
MKKLALLVLALVLNGVLVMPAVNLVHATEAPATEEAPANNNEEKK